MSVHKVRPWWRSSGKQRSRIVGTRVWLNGRELRDCFYADARRGVVRTFVRGESGLLLHNGREVLRRELRGRVRVRTTR
jgi:hypothetical protein